MVKVLIVRHGYSVTNKEKRYTGQTDVPLDAIGYRQAEAACKYIAEKYKVDVIYSSDLCRVVETVRPLSERLSLPIVTDARLREFAMGEWEGKSFSEVESLFPETYACLKKTPWLVRYDGGESCDEVFFRVRECVKEIIKENEGKTVVIASHGGAIRQILRFAFGFLPGEPYEIPHLKNASISVIECEGDVIRVVSHSETEHLAALNENEIEVM